MFLIFIRLLGPLFADFYLVQKTQNPCQILYSSQLKNYAPVRRVLIPPLQALHIEKLINFDLMCDKSQMTVMLNILAVCFTIMKEKIQDVK